MIIGINATAAFRKPRTGVEEYTYQIIKHLTMLEASQKHRFILYAPAQLAGRNHALPGNFEVRRLNWPWPMWTQIRLAYELLGNKVESLFIPVHILPKIHPQNSTVTIHGLEYETYPQLYSWRQRQYLRYATKYALENASKIIAVSEATKKDLISYYGADPDKITVIYHGITGFKKIKNKEKPRNHQPYLLFIGRLETKKNVQGLIRAFDILKEKYNIPHKLILAGCSGYGYEQIKIQIINSRYKNDILEKGYISEKEKRSFLRNADLFVLPSFYEGFGIPILEAQACGTAVVTANTSAMPEVAGKAAVLVDPHNDNDIALGIYQLINDPVAKHNLIKAGYENIKRFSWVEAAALTLDVLTK